MANAHTQGPLSGVRIIDFTTVVMAPYATRILADMGADVIRIDSPKPDLMREFEPKRSPAMSGVALNLHRNKRSILLDLKNDHHKQAMRDLIKSADALVTNIRPKAVKKLGFSPEDCAQLNPQLLYCSAVGYGSNGPYGGRAAYDDVIQAVSGTASMASWITGEPAFVPSAIADKVAGLHIAYAVAAGLYQKAATGKGDFVEVPMAESMVSFNLVEHLNGHTFEPKEEPFSYLRLRTPNRKPRRTKDGWVCLLPYSDQNYERFFAFAGRPEVMQDPRFATINDRVENADSLYAIVEEVAAEHTSAEWLEYCAEASIPCAPVVQLDEVEQDPHFDAVDMLEVTEHPTEGAYRVIRDPLRWESVERDTVFMHAPHPGEHNSEVFKELGWSEEQIAKLV